jgi:hypothetical protein
MRHALLVAALLAVPGTARAAFFGDIVFELKKKISETRYDEFSQMELNEAVWFNKVACECNRPFGVEMILGSNAPPVLETSETVQIWVGSDCSRFQDQERRCKHLTALNTPITAFHNQEHTLDIGTRDLMYPVGGDCNANVQGDTTVFALIDEGSNSSYEHNWSIQVKYDGQPPTAPTMVEANGVEDGLSVSWQIPSTGETANLRGFQVLCATGDGAPLFAEPPAEPEYAVHADIEGCTAPSPTGPDAGVPAHDAGAAKPQDMLADFRALDPAYICSDLAAGTSESARIDLSGENVIDLDPNEEILIRVVAIDLARNQTSVETTSGAPQEVRDGWENYHDANGAADGGFCFVATAAYGDYDHPYVRILRELRDDTLAQSDMGRAFITWYYERSPAWADFLRRHDGWRAAAAVGLFPVVALAWLWNHVGLGGFLLLALLAVAWRRRRRLALALAAASLFAAPAARAQVYFDEAAELEDPIPRSRWAFELKFGPYHPDVDGEEGLMGSPFDDTFGSGSSLYIGVELDFFFFNRFGELGVAGAIGHTSDSAKAWKQDPATGRRLDERSDDDTGFRMVPLSLSIVYRLTELADRTVIPLVPYGKLGLSYALWQMTRGNGDLSRVMDDEARGGTLGWHGTAGVMVRAEGIDPQAARSMQNELGVEHAGFFFELTYADVSGLFQSNRLHVGDLFWTAGVAFEF